MKPSIKVFRLWLDQSSRKELSLTTAALALALAVGAWTLTPVGSRSAADRVSADSTVDEGTATPLDPELPTEGASTRKSNRSRAGASQAAANAAGEPGGSVTVRPGFTGSDIGVQADSIKLGFTIINLGGAESAGLSAATNLRDDIREVIDALVDDANKRGGVLGRKIVAAKASVDLLNADDQRQKCLQLTETEKVFGVIDSFAILYEPAKACVTVEHKRPLLSNIPGPRRNVEAAFPYQVSPVDDYNQRLKNWVFWARDSGFFGKGFRKLGILSDSCATSALDDPKIGLKAYLRQIGVTSWSEFRANCDISSQQTSGTPAVLQHIGDDVSHVFFATIGAGPRDYFRAAQAQGYKPKYGVSDMFGLTSTGTSRGWQPDQFDRTRAVTTNHEGERVRGKPFTPEAERCSKIFTEHGLDPIRDYSFDSEALFLCEELHLFIRTAMEVGPNLTRLAWATRVQTIGEFRPSFGDVARFDREGKVTGGDTIATIEWRRECTCYWQVEGFRPAY